MADDVQWFELFDPWDGTPYKLRFRSKDHLLNKTCPTCGKINTMYIGETADGSERFAICNECESGERYLPKESLC